MANTLVEGDEVINVITGYFARRWEEMLRQRGLHPHSISAKLGQTVPPEVVESAFKEHKNAKALIACQVDTSSGVISPIDRSPKLRENTAQTFIVDAISSFGGVPIEMDKWGVDFCVGYPSKCLSSISGVVPIAVSKRVWEIVESQDHKAGWYFNLKIFKKYFEDWGTWGHPYSTTLPVQAVIALREAVDIVHREGLSNCFMRHKKARLAVREAARAIGLTVLASEDVAAPVVSAILIGDGLEKRVQSMLLDQYNMHLGGSLVDVPLIRIGHMGTSASPQFIFTIISALEAVLHDLGRPIQWGAALAAAQKHLGPHGKP